MPSALKVLGQVLPAAGTLTALYTVPSKGQATCSTLAACNQGSAPTTIRVSVAIAGAADASAQYLFYDVPVAAKDTFSATIGITLAPTDAVRCRSANGQVSFHLFGEELS